MNKSSLLIILCAGFLLWMACTTESDSVSGQRTLLSEVIQVVDDNPKQALTLLASIPDPDFLSESDQDQYWQYVVILTQARYMDYQDITIDSLILDAQRYFAKTPNYEMAARASYYAAIYWYEGRVGDKASEYWQEAFSFAEQASNDLFVAKSAYSLGLFYFNQNQWEDAKTYCQKALTFYDNKPGAELYKFSSMEMLGQTYREQKDFGQAYQYFENGLDAAKKLNNVKYESHFLRDKSIIHREKKEYSKAKEYLDLALSILSTQSDAEEMLRTYLSYAKLYEDMNRPDSALHYLRLVEDQTPQITYPNTRRDMYTELATYYQINKGDVDKVLLYLELAHKENLRIMKSQEDEKIKALHLKLEQSKQGKQTQGQIYEQIFDYVIIAECIILVFLILLAANRYRLKEQIRFFRGKLISHTIDQTHFLMTGLRSVAKSTDDLLEIELAYAGSPAWEQQLVLREKFLIQMAECAKRELIRFHNGEKALSQLAIEDLAIIHMSQLKVPNEQIGWMLGHQGDRELYVKLQKGQIRQIMTSAGMKEKYVKKLLPLEGYLYI